MKTLSETLQSNDIAPSCGILLPAMQQQQASADNLFSASFKILAHQASLKYGASDAAKFRAWVDRNLPSFCPESSTQLDEPHLRTLFSAISLISHMYYWGTSDETSAEKEPNVLSPALQTMWLAVAQKLGITHNPSGSLPALVLDNFDLEDLAAEETYTYTDIKDKAFRTRYGFLYGAEAGRYDEYAKVLVALEAASGFIAHDASKIMEQLSSPSAQHTDVVAQLEQYSARLHSAFLAFERGRMNQCHEFWEKKIMRTLKPFPLQATATSPMMPVASDDPITQLFSIQFLARLFAVDLFKGHSPNTPTHILPKHQAVLTAASGCGSALADRLAKFDSAHDLAVAYKKIQDQIRTFLRRNAISTAYFLARPKRYQPGHRNLEGEVVVDFLVVGAGPAGIQASYLLKKAGSDYLLLEKGVRACTFFSTNPRHRMLISLNKVHTLKTEGDFALRHDWNSLINTEDLLVKYYNQQIFPPASRVVHYMNDFTQINELEAVYEIKVNHVTKLPDGRFRVLATQTVHQADGTTSQVQRTFLTKYVILSTGVIEPHLPKAPGIEMITMYEDVQLCKEPYRNKRVLILGKGNSAMECANHINDVVGVLHLASPHHIMLSWDTHYVGSVRSINANILDQYQLKSQVGIINGVVQRIRRREDGGFIVTFSFTDTPQDPFVDYEYDQIICATGWRYVEDCIFDPKTIKVETRIDNRFAKTTEMGEVPGTPGLFFFGTCSQGNGYKHGNDFYQMAPAGFIHGFRFSVRSQVSYILNRDFNKPLPHLSFPGDNLSAVVDHALFRADTSASIFDMFTVLCDIIVLPTQADNNFTYLYDLYRKWVLNGDNDNGPREIHNRYFVLFALEYGHRGNVFAYDYKIHSSPDKADLSWAIHPVFYMYKGDKCVKKLHLYEQLDSEFRDPEIHVKPAMKFMTECVQYALNPPPADKEVFIEAKNPDLAQAVITYRTEAAPIVRVN